MSIDETRASLGSNRLCLVTGGAGFIGSHLATRLVSLGHRVRILDDLSTGREENLERIPGEIDVLREDMRDFSAVERAVEGVDYVFHLAALSSVPRSLEDPRATTEVNVTGTVSVLEGSRRAGVRCVVASSSSAVYGDLACDVKSEDLPPEPISPYGASKLAAEQFYATYARNLGLPTVALRYFNVFGPWQDPDSHYAAVVPRFLEAFAAGEPPVIYGDGDQTRDFTYVDNVIEANLLACVTERVWGRAVNIACGDAIRVNELAQALKELMGSDVEPRHVEERAGDIRHSRADMSLARELLGFEPSFGFRQGIEATVSWYLDEVSGADAG